MREQHGRCAVISVATGGRALSDERRAAAADVSHDAEAVPRAARRADARQADLADFFLAGGRVSFQVPFSAVSKQKSEW